MARASAEGASAARVRAAYWSVLLALLALGLLRLLVLGNALEGIAVLVFTVPGCLALLNLWGPTMRVWHMGGSACWVAYSAFNIYKLTHDPVSLNWVIYIGSGACALLSLALSLGLFLATSPKWSAWRGGKAAKGPLLPQSTAAEPLSADDEQPAPLVWPPPDPNGMTSLPPADGAELEPTSAGAGKAVWPPEYTGD